MRIEEINRHLQASIEGSQIAFNQENIAAVTDIAKVKKAYKLGPPLKGRGSGGSGDDLKEMEMIVLGMMALRGAT